jgi:sugar phosphate isomerase/epimerase
MKEFGLQLYSIRDHFTNAEDTRESFRRMKEYGYTHAQTAGTYSYISPENFRALANEYGIRIMGTHYDWKLICGDVPGTVRYHRILGAPYIGIGSMPSEARSSKAALLQFIAKFNEMARIYKGYGFKMTYHHHSFEFVKLEGKTIMDYLIEYLDPDCTMFVIDTYWAQVGGADVRALLERLNGRVADVHLKDLSACHKYLLANGKTLSNLPERIEVGCGTMNFKGIIETAEKCGCIYFTVEDEVYSTGESWDSMRISAENIKATLLEG